MMASPSLISTPPALSLGPLLLNASAATPMTTKSSASVTMFRRRSLAQPMGASASVSSAVTATSGAVTVRPTDEEQPAAAESKIGSRVRVKVPLKVYHVPKVPEMDLAGMEGLLKQCVAVWKGKRISANLPFKVEFVADVEGRGKVKFFAHLREDEFEFLD